MSNRVDPTSFDAIATPPVRTTGGRRMLMRGAQNVTGAALILWALGLWFAPGASWDHELMLFKLPVSAVGGMSVIALLQWFVRSAAPTVEVDTIRHEVRLVQPR